jgi:hypothetical protein
MLGASASIDETALDRSATSDDSWFALGERRQISRASASVANGARRSRRASRTELGAVGEHRERVADPARVDGPALACRRRGLP